MRKIFLICFLSLAMIGCGDGGSNDNAEYEEPSLTIDKTITLSISANILKMSFLVDNEVSNPQFVVLEGPKEGNVTLLDNESGRFSYLTSSSKNDSFVYVVSDGNGTSYNIKVNLSNTHIPIMTNNGIQEDFNTSLPSVIEGKELVNFSSNLPVMVIDMGDQEILDDPKIPGTITLFEPGEDNRTRLNSMPTHIGYMEIEMRGSSSQYYYPKKQYGMDTVLTDGEDDDVVLLGMPKEHKWILQAPYGDKSLMRNYLAYHKTRQIDESKYYAVRSKYIELLTRVGDQYRYDGIYVFMEKIKRDGDRLDIAKLTDEDVQYPEITGGYILKKDGTPDPEEFSFHTTFGTTITVSYPEDEDLNSDQEYYIENYIQELEKALRSDDFNVTDSANYYGNWIDEGSFIVHILSREFFMDVDTWLFSEYFHKDKDQNLAMTPVWDFNTGMGNNDYRFVGRSDIWVYEYLRTDEGKENSSLRYWVERLMSDPAFRQKTQTKWKELRRGIWSDANLSSFIASTQSELSEAAERNFERWPNVLGVYVWPNRQACEDGGTPIYCPTFDRAVNEHLRSWLLERATWIDDNL